MSEWITPDFVSSIAWPLVALVGLIVLGPFGVLSGVIKSFSGVFKEFTNLKDDLEKTLGDTTKLEDHLEKVNNNLDRLNEAQKNIENLTEKLNSFEDEMSGAVGSVSSSVNQVNKDLEELQTKFENFAEIMGDQNSVSESDHRVATIDPELSNLYHAAITRWQSFVERFRSWIEQNTRLEFDGRAIGGMAWELTDKRRRIQLQEVQATNIEDCFSRIKSLQRHKNDYDRLSKEEYESLIEEIKGLDSYLR